MLFDEPLDEAFHIQKYHFPSGVPESGYGEYAVHVVVDAPRQDGFRVASAFEPESKRTSSRLPFFFGFRVFGHSSSYPLPVWRTLLSDAVRAAAHGRWALSLLYTAFSLESFIDQQLADRLRAAQVGESYIDHVLQVGEREYELSALNEATGRLSKSKSGVKALARRLNKDVFTPRNKLAHGRLTDRAIDADMVVKALKTTVGFVWDSDPRSRYLLVTPIRTSSFEALIDDSLLQACHEDLK